MLRGADIFLSYFSTGACTFHTAFKQHEHISNIETYVSQINLWIQRVHMFNCNSRAAAVIAAANNYKLLVTERLRRLQ